MSSPLPPPSPQTPPDPPSEPRGDAPQGPAAPTPPGPAPKKQTPLELAWGYVRDYFVGEDPSFWVAMVPLLALAAIIYTRHPATNYIFDEQEALLANPFVNGKVGGWLTAFTRDFWGLPADRSVGSYRPIPNLFWRALWQLSHNPWLAHWFNVLLHAANGAALVVLTHMLTNRRAFSWLVGAVFVATAVLTEAVSGVVGIADVLGGLGAVLGLLSLTLPIGAMPFAVFGSVLFGLFCKESALVCVPLLPFAALLLAPVTHPDKPRRVARALLCALGSIAAFVLYVEARRRLFPAPIDTTLNEPLPDGATPVQKAVRAFMVWFHQPNLPKDPLNNPLVKGDFAHRTAGALRVYWRGLTQLVFPRTLSGDYSFPQEPLPEALIFPESVLGAAFLVLPPLGSVALWVRSMLRERRLRQQATAEAPFSLPHDDRLFLLVAVGLTWIVVSYFPHSNIPTLLPTVRAERFWYFPAIGSCFVVATFFAMLFQQTRHIQDGSIAVSLFTLFFTFQCGKAYQHSTHYRDDLTFWAATREAVPNSAKAHLNYSVMWGARGRLDIRLEANRTALELAPEWPMAHVYLGDTLCRLHRAEEAWPHYKRGFVLAENDPNLLSLGLQCMWDEQVPSTDGTARSFKVHEDELVSLADARPGTWLAYLVKDMAYNAEKHNGVDPKYRPRGYNEGPKDLSRQGRPRAPRHALPPHIPTRFDQITLGRRPGGSCATGGISHGSTHDVDDAHTDSRSDPGMNPPIEKPLISPGLSATISLSGGGSPVPTSIIVGDIGTR